MRKWMMRACGVLALLGCAGLLGLYAFGRALTDQSEWTQFAYWMPGWALVWPAWGLFAVGWLMLLDRRAKAKPGRGGLRLRLKRVALAALFVGAAGVTLHTAWFTRFDRLLLSPFRATAQGAGPFVRLVHWNAMAPDTFPREVTLPPVLEAFDPDVMLFTMALSPWQIEIVMKDVPKAYTRTTMDTFHVLSRWPLKHAETRKFGLGGEVPAGIDRDDPRQISPPPDEARHTLEYVYNVVGRRLGMPRRHFRNTDPGSVLELRFDATAALGRELVVWYIDLPSDPFLSKAALAERVRERLAALEADRGKPDFIVGDFNIPRGSASLARMMDGRRSAFDDAGAGYFSTWPRARPALHIDHMFMDAAWRCVRYERMDTGRSDHFVQAGMFEVDDQRRSGSRDDS